MSKGSGKATIDSAFGLEVIHYEVKMLYAAANLLEQAKPETAKYNAYLESFLIHGRNLLEIFFFETSKESVRAGQFFDKAKCVWERNRELCKELSPLLWDKASVMLAHPLYERNDYMLPPKKVWQYGDIARELEGEVNRFVSLMKPGAFSENPWFIKLAALTLNLPSPTPATSAKPITPDSIAAADAGSKPSVRTATGSTSSEFVAGVIDVTFGGSDESK